MKPVALVCIAKNEDHYIQEWLDYHLKLGFDHIFIYQNDWRFAGEHPHITKIPYDGKHLQIQCYNQFIKDYHKQYSWAAFFDVDEFLVLKKHASIHEFLQEFSQVPAVGINWAMFGDSGHTEVVDGEYSVLKRFTRRQEGLCPLIKTILRLHSGARMKVHCPQNCFTLSPNHVKFRSYLSPDMVEGPAYLAHFFSKTRPEFALKVARGRFSRRHPFRTLDEFTMGNHNNIEDTTARDFLYPPNKDN